MKLGTIFQRLTAVLCGKFVEELAIISDFIGSYERTRRKVCSKLKPTVLLVTAARWFPTARLAVALADAGCTVQAVCPPGHPIAKTTAVEHTFTYRGLAPLKSISAALAATNPDLLVSCDDLATGHLHALYAQNAGAGKSGSAICALIERSIGAPENFAIIDDRASFMQISERAGVRVPRTAIVTNSRDLDFFASQMDFPMVLKANGTSGGDGVRVVRTIEEAQRAFRTLQAPPLLARAVKRALFDRNTTLLRPSLLRHQSSVIAQSFIPGTEATSAVVCWKGEVLASLHFEVLQKSAPAGHATVLRRVAHPEMATAAESMVRRLQLSGFHGFDFMLDHKFGHVYLIEINPRATQVSHLNLGTGHHLPAALIAAFRGTTAGSSVSVTENDVVALFPQEWRRDPASQYLHSGYHDVPRDQPGLVRAGFRAPGARNLRK